MFRTPSYRSQSLADLPKSANQVQSEKSTEKARFVPAPEDAAPGGDAWHEATTDARPGSQTAQAPSLRDGVRCPVAAAQGKAEKSLLAEGLGKSAFNAMGHNGCVLDPDRPESVGVYLAATSRILFSPYQQAPDDEIGRMLEVVRRCYDRAEKSMKLSQTLAASDKPGLARLTRKTAEAMAKQSVDVRGKNLPLLERADLQVRENRRLKPFAEKLLWELSRQGQAERHHLAWARFARDIEFFCLDYIGERFHMPGAGAAVLRGPDTMPAAAYPKKVRVALWEKWEDLADAALLEKSPAPETH